MGVDDTRTQDGDDLYGHSQSAAMAAS